MESWLVGGSVLLRDERGTEGDSLGRRWPDSHCLVAWRRHEAAQRRGVGMIGIEAIVVGLLVIITYLVIS